MLATSTIKAFGFLVDGTTSPDMVSAHYDVPSHVVVLNVADYYDNTIKQVSMDQEYTMRVIVQLVAALAENGSRDGFTV